MVNTVTAAIGKTIKIHALYNILMIFQKMSYNRILILDSMICLVFENMTIIIKVMTRPPSMMTKEGIRMVLAVGHAEEYTGIPQVTLA
jgi:spermidine synthase